MHRFASIGLCLTITLLENTSANCCYFFTFGDISCTISKNLKKFDGVVPVLKTTSSIKLIRNKKILNLDRNKIFLSQTPQAFNFKKIFDLQKKGNSKITDDASLFINNLDISVVVPLAHPAIFTEDVLPAVVVLANVINPVLLLAFV